LYSSQGYAHELLVWLFKYPKKVNVITTPLALELESVLMRRENINKLSHLTHSDIEQFINDICHISQHQEINFLWRPFLPDAKDDIVLEAAFNSSSKYIVTYNLKDFKNVEQAFNIKVVTPKILLETLERNKQ
jgi:predicted nucleic acid-binding protein